MIMIADQRTVDQNFNILTLPSVSDIEQLETQVRNARRLHFSSSNFLDPAHLSCMMALMASRDKN